MGETRLYTNSLLQFASHPDQRLALSTRSTRPHWPIPIPISILPRCLLAFHDDANVLSHPRHKASEAVQHTTAYAGSQSATAFERRGAMSRHARTLVLQVQARIAPHPTTGGAPVSLYTRKQRGTRVVDTATASAQRGQ